MPSVSIRFRRLVLASSTLLVAYLASPLARILPLMTTAVADDGISGTGALTANNFVFGICIILIFILGYGVRDAIERHAIRAKAKARSAPAPKRV